MKLYLTTVLRDLKVDIDYFYPVGHVLLGSLAQCIYLLWLQFGVRIKEFAAQVGLYNGKCLKYICALFVL